MTYISFVEPALEEDGTRDLRSFTASELHDILATFGAGHKRQPRALPKFGSDTKLHQRRAAERHRRVQQGAVAKEDPCRQLQYAGDAGGVQQAAGGVVAGGAAAAPSQEP